MTDPKQPSFAGRVAKPHERQPTGVIDNVAAYVPVGVSRFVSSYMPAILKGFARRAGPIPHADDAANIDKQPETITWANFQWTELLDSRRRHYLVLGYLSGFQIWDVSNPGEMVEICSQRDFPARLVKILQKPATDDSTFSAVRPLAAIVSAEDLQSFPLSAVKIYSLQSHTFVHTMDVGSPVVGVQASQNLIAVGTTAAIHCYHPTTLQLLYVLPCGALPETRLSAAVGARLIAYAAPNVAPPSTGHNSAWNVDTAKHLATEAATHLVAGLSYLGEVGKRHLNSYLFGDEPATQQVVSVAPDAAPAIEGVLMVRDIQTRNVIGHIQAHSRTLTLVRFDRSETLLLTADASGRDICIYKILPNRIQLTYRLSRGVTEASILDADISDDGRWVCVLSEHGTVHVFAIRPCGGAIDMNELLAPPSSYPYACETPVQTLTSVVRIRQRVDAEHAHVQACIFLPSGDIAPYLCTLSTTGALSIDKLVVTQQKPLVDEPCTIQVTTTREREWNMRRDLSWDIVVNPLGPAQETLPPAKSDAASGEQGAAQAEIATHEPACQPPLWRRQQFTICNGQQTIAHPGLMNPLPATEGSPEQVVAGTATEAQLKENLLMAMKTPLERNG